MEIRYPMQLETSQEKTKVLILTSEKNSIQPKTAKSVKEGHYIVVKGSAH
jgi:hypothetical protein